MSKPRDPYARLSGALTAPLRTLSQIAAEAIEGLIAEGELSSGDRINESHLAETLGISRGPIREACRTLEQAGLLVSITNKGTYVRALGVEQAQHLYELRAALAGLTGRLVARRGQDEDIAGIVALVDQMDAAVAECDPESYFQLNLDFHARLIEVAANPELTVTYERTVKQLLLMRRRGLAQARNIRVSNTEHRRIADALQARDPDAADAAMRAHVESGFRRLIDTA